MLFAVGRQQKVSDGILCHINIFHRALEGLRQILPQPLKTGYFNDLIRDDQATVKFYVDLMSLVNSSE